jgi:hypothetical protein
MLTTTTENIYLKNSIYDNQNNMCEISIHYRKVFAIPINVCVCASKG